MRTLNWQQRLFVINYLGKANGNATKAAELAGYRNPQATGSQLLQHPIVHAALQAKLEEAAMQADEVLARLSDIASGDHDDFLEEYDHQTGVDENGDPVYQKRLHFNYGRAKKRGKTHLISQIEIAPDGTTKVKLHSSADALDKLARVHGLYKERIDIYAAIGDTEEDRRKFVTVFGAIAQLEGASSGGTGGSTPEPGALLDHSIEGELGSCPSLETVELPPTAYRAEADNETDHNAGT